VVVDGGLYAPVRVIDVQSFTYKTMDTLQAGVHYDYLMKVGIGVGITDTLIRSFEQVRGTS